jgi:cytohesin
MGRSPLHDVARKEVAELLIANGANVNAKDDRESTPLHKLANNGDKEIVELLIQKDADVNAKTKDENVLTPLHNALMGNGGNKEIVELLIAGGTDVNAKDGTGLTPLDYAKRHPEIANLLRKHGGKTGEELKTEGK